MMTELIQQQQGVQYVYGESYFEGKDKNTIITELRDWQKRLKESRSPDEREVVGWWIIIDARDQMRYCNLDPIPDICDKLSQGRTASDCYDVMAILIQALEEHGGK